MSPGLLKLPEELCCELACCLEPQDICSLRLVCKRLYAAATQVLFSSVRLYPSEDSIERYNKILEHTALSNHVRHVELNTLCDGEEEEEEAGEQALTEDEIKAFRAFRKFPNLRSVTLRFSEHGASGNSWPGADNFYSEPWSDWPQTYWFRQSVLQRFFKSLTHPSASNIKDICVDNIQNMNNTSFLQSETAVSVLSRLDALRLYITTEDHSPSPERNLNMEELHNYMTELPSLWLRPAASNLTTLVLYQSFYFGYSPKLDLRGVHFPNLRTLALGNYVFTHDWQLDWLSSHSSSLQKLYLDDCIVVFYAKLYCDVDSEGYPLIPHSGNHKTTPERFDADFKFMHLTWSRILHHLRTHLTSLRHFRMGKSTRWLREKHPFHRSEYEDLAIGLFNDRYQMFDMGVGPCQYTTELWGHEGITEGVGRGMPDGDMAVAFLKRMEEQTLEEKDALGELLNAIGQPLPKNSKHVKGLIGTGVGFWDDV